MSVVNNFFFYELILFLSPKFFRRMTFWEDISADEESPPILYTFTYIYLILINKFSFSISRLTKEQLKREQCLVWGPLTFVFCLFFHKSSILEIAIMEKEMKKL